MRVYVAGPIRGYPDGNRAKFDQAVALLKEMGHQPVNPHDIPTNHEGPCIGGPASVEDHTHQYGCYLRDDIMVLMFCDAIALLPGWQNSKGAATEAHVAQSIGLPEVPIDELYQ